MDKIILTIMIMCSILLGIFGVRHVWTTKPQVHTLCNRFDHYDKTYEFCIKTDTPRFNIIDMNLREVTE